MEQIISVLPASISSVGWNHADAVASHDLDESAVLQNFTSANSAVFNSTQDTNLPPATVPSQPNTTPIPSSAVPAGDENGIFDAPDSTPSSTSGSIPADTTIGSEISVPDGTVLSSPLEATLPPTEVAPIPDTVPPPPEPAEIVAPPPTDLPSDGPISISVPSQSIVWGVFPLARVAFPLAQFSTLASTAEASLTDTVAPDTTTSSRESIDVLSSTTDSTVTVPPPPSTVSPMYTIVPAPHNSITLSNFSLPKLRTGQILQTVQLRLSLGGSYTPPPGMTTLPSLDVSYTVDSFTGNAGSILLDGEVSNAMNGGYYLLTLPVFSDPAVLKNLSITITYQGDVSRLSHLYIDSAWLEIATATFDASVLKDRYQPSALEHLAMPKHMDFLSAETDFTRTETPQFTLKYKSQRNLMVQMFRGLLGKDLATIQSVAFMHGDDGLIGITPTVNITTDGLISIVLSEADKSKLQPGEYTVAVEVDEGGYVSTDSFQFQWGLLSINTNQTEYTSGDVVNFSMGALSPNGNTVCDAHLNLYVTDPQGVITMVPTTESGLCHGNNVVNVPDYSAQMVASEFGTYQTYLERVDDTGAIIAHTSDSFTVVSNQRITIERNGPTRIFPPAPYPMQLTVTTQAGFVGQLIERVPNNFIITDTTATIRKTPNAIELVWDLDLVAGSAETLSYTFDAPDLSPFLYQLGPASLESTKPITLTTVVSPPATLTATPAPGTTTIEFATDTPATADIFASSTSSTGTTSSPIVNTPEVVMTTTSTYTAFTELRQWQIASDATGNMILFWDDGASIPVGWTCLSCGSGTFFQKFAYGGSIYNTIGGALTTTPTATGNVNITTNPATTRNGAGTISPQTHTHTYTPTISAASTLPSYRQLRVIEYTAAAGEPPSLPAGAIGVFDTSILPTGWTQYSAEDGYYIYGENIPGTTGGSNTHTHTITGTSGAAAGVGTRVQTGGVQAVGAAGAHTHTVSTTTPALNTEPPYLEVVLGKLGSATSSPNDLISMWTDTVPTGWLDVSSTGGDPFNNRFLKASTTYGTTGGAATHTFPNMNGITTSVPSGTTNSRNTAPVAGASGFHTHLVDVTAFSAESSLPPYLTVIFGKRIGFNAWYTQTSFRWYVNNNALTPTDAWPVGGTDLIEAEPITATSSPVKPGQTIRLRINTTVSNVIAATGSTFKLQYAEGTVCSTIPSWTDVGSSTAAEIWRGYNNAGASDHATLASSVLSASNVNETYEENGVATGTPNAIPITNVGEWDFVLQNNGALANTQYCFQMVKGDGSAFLAYDTYPQLLTNSNPNVSVIVTPFANEKVMSATTSLSFYATDTESDVLEYEVMIDDTYDFSSPVLTKTSANYPTDAGWSSATSSSGATTTYVIQPADALSSGTTYWWKVRARDPDGSNTWSNYSSATSFTVDTTLIENAWHQTLGLQFERDSLTNISTTTGTAEMTSIVSPGLDTITTQSAWAQEYANTTYPAGTVNGAYTISAGSNRVLLVAVASTRTTVGTQTVTVSYGGQPLTLATGDGTNAANRNHTYLFYLNEAGITAAAGANLDVTVSGGVSFYTFVYASVYTGVDQSTVYTDAQNFNSAVANNAVGPFATGLTVAAGDQAIEVINLARSATGNAARTIATWSNGTWPAPSTVATVYQVAGAYNLGLHINNRNVTTLATETSQHTANSANTVDSMSGISLKPAALTATAVVMSPEIDSALVPGYTNWGQLSWGVTEPSGTLTSLQVYYSNVTACDTLVPDGDLPGNSTGFTSASSGMFLNSLAMATYSKLCLKLTLGIGTGSTTPSLTDWTLTWVIPNQPPSVPALADTPAFDNDKATTTTPSVGGFVSSDLDLDSMQYQIEVDTNADFSSPILSKQSANYPTDAGWVAATFSADATTTYTIQPADALTDGATYWWRVRARDPFGTNTWSNYSVARSFTVSTAITVPEWFQTTDEQFATTATFSNATTTGSGGVTIDNPTVTVSELDAWSTGNTKTVSVGTDRLLVVAIISEDSGTNSTVSSVTYGGQNLIPIDNQQIGTGFSNGLWLGYLDEAGIAAAANSTIAPSWVGGTPNNGIEYASAVYQHVNQTFPIRDQSGNALATGATITPVSSISALTGDMMVYVAETSNGLTHTPPAGYTEGTEQDTGGTGFVAASAYKAIVSNSTEYPTATWSASGNRLLMIAADLVPAAPRGTILSPEINFTSVIGQSQWGEVDWYLNELTGGNSRLRVYYTNAVACDTIIPDVALAGNAAGFISGGSPVDISSLATSTYNRICLQMTIDRGTASSSPELSDWGVRWQRTASFNQNAFWWYANTNADTPTDTWPVGVTGSELVENQVMDSGYPSQFSDVLRLRLGVGVSAVTATGKSFKLQYAAGAVCSDTMSWADVGPIGSTTALWRGYNNAGVSDGATLTSALLSGTNVLETYEAENNATAMPNAIPAGQNGEWDWVLQNEAAAGTSYCFRLVNPDGSRFKTYAQYPMVVTNQSPTIASIDTPFDNQKTPNLKPSFTFAGLDPESDDIDYQIQIDDNSDFSSAVVDANSIANYTDFNNVLNPSDKSPFNSGETIEYIPPSSLTNGVTYWWRVRAKDTNASTQYEAWSTPQSFTIDTSVVLTTWFQTTEAQFGTDSLEGTEATPSNLVDFISGSTTGTTTSTAIRFSDVTSGNAWGTFTFSDTGLASDILYHFEYYNGTIWQLIPDTDLVANSTGFDTSPVDLIDLNTETYNTIRIRANFNAGSPTLTDWTVVAGERVAVPTHFSLFDNEKTGTTTPTFTFLSTDPQGDDLQYEFSWSTDATFVSGSTTVNSTTSPGFIDVTNGVDTNPYASGHTISYTMQSGLTDGTTYWWRVRAKDPYGGNSYSFWSDPWSFTVDVTATTSTWFQTTKAQFDTDTLVGLVATTSGSVSTVPAAVTTYNFNGITNPSASNIARNFRITVTDPTYPPLYDAIDTITTNGTNTGVPNLLSGIAGYSSSVELSSANYTSISAIDANRFTTANPGVTRESVFWAEIPIAQTASQIAQIDLHLVGYQGGTPAVGQKAWFGIWQPGSTTPYWQALETAQFTTDHTYTGSITSNFSKYFDGNNALHLIFYNENAGSRLLINYVEAVVTSNSATSGTITSTPITFTDGAGPAWNSFSWNDIRPGASTVTYQIEYQNGVGGWALIPDTDLPGNAAGFSVSPVDLSGLDTTTYGVIRTIAQLTCSGANCPTVNDWTVKWSPGYTVSGTAYEYDGTTPVISGTVNVAVNGVLQAGKSSPISAGAWSIPDVTYFPNDIITVFVSGAADADEAVAITKYATVPNITGLQLQKRHLTIGSADHTTITNTDMSLYDNTNDEDLFFAVNAGNDVTMCADVGCDDAGLVILANNTYAPGAGADVVTHDIRNDGTLTLSNTILRVGGSWDNNATTSMGASTVVFTATSTSEIIDSTGANSASFYNVTLGETSGTATWTLASTFTVGHDLGVTYGTLARGIESIDIAAALTTGPAGYWTGMGTTTFNGTAVSTWIDSNATKQNIGQVVVNGTAHTLLLGSNTLAQSMTIVSGNTLDLSTNTRVLQIASDWYNGGTFQARNGKVSFVATSVNHSINVGGASFYNLDFAGVGGAWSFMQSTLTVSNNFTLATGTVTLPSATTTFAGSFINTGGTFVHNNGTAKFTAASAKTITMLGTTFTNAFYDLTFTGAGSWVITDVTATSSHTVTKSAGTLTLPSGTFAVGGSFLNTGGSLVANDGTLELFSTSAQTLSVNTSSLYNLIKTGTGTTTMTDPDVTITNNLLVTSGTLVLPLGTLTLSGSLTNTGVLSPQTGTILLNAVTTGKTVSTGASSLYNLTFNSVPGGWTVMDNATTTGTTTLSAGTFTLAAGKTLAVDGVFVNALDDASTTWTGSTLSLGSGAYTINTKTTGADSYGTLRLEPNVDIQMWNSLAATTTVDITSSLYSQDHNAVDGSLYIWGDYHRTTGSDYWDYATDFDGTALASSSRLVSVKFAPSASYSLDAGTLEVLGTTTATTSVDNQGSGTYAMSIKGGTFNAQYYTFRNLDALGLNFTGTPTVTSLSDGDIQVAVNGGSMITVSSSTIGANIAKQIYRINFATSSGITSGHNVAVSAGNGTPVHGIYSTAGTSTFVVPDGVTSMTLKVWSAGAGGAGGGGGTSAGGAGGGGGFITGTIAVVPGESLTLVVGSGGGGGTGDATNGGGGGGGGGYSAVLRGSTKLFVAGAGGAGGGGDNATGGTGGAGGPGGGAIGGNGVTSGTGIRGTGGTQTTGGTGGTGACDFNGSNGGLFTGGAGGGGVLAGAGGAGGTNSGGTGGSGQNVGSRAGGGGGGGAGYYGGGGGCSDTTTDGTGGGGGGSSYAISTATATSTTAGSGMTAGNVGDADYGGSSGQGGTGGAAGSGLGGNGNPGRIAVVYTPLLNDAPSYWWFRSSTGNLQGEAYDVDPAGDPGIIRWDNSTYGITISGTVYADEGVTLMGAPVCDDVTPVVKIVIDGSTSYTGACSSASSTYSISGITYTGDPNVLVYLDTNGAAAQPPAVTLHSETTGSGTTNPGTGVIVINRAATISNGDLLVVIAGKSSTAALTAPAGWTTGDTLASTVGNTMYTGIWYKRVIDAATEPTSYNFIGNTSAAVSYWSGALTHVDPVNPQDVSFSGKWVNSQNDTTPNAALVTTTVNGDYVLAASYINADNAVTAPGAPWATRAVNVFVGGDNSNLVVSSQTKTPAGSTAQTTVSGVAVGADSQNAQFSFRRLTYASSSVHAAVLTRTPTADIADLAMYGNRVITRHENAATLAISNMIGYDYTNDSDLPFTAVSGTPNVVTVRPNTELHIWTGTTFTPGGTVTIQSGGTANAYDGSVHLDTGAHYTASGVNTFSFGGNLTQGASAVFSPASSSVIMTATTTGKTITASGGDTVAFHNLQFDGSGGGWNLNSDITATGDIQVTTGTVTGTKNITVSNGSLSGNGLLSLGAGTVQLTMTNTLGGTQPWTFANLTLGNGSIVGTTTPAGTATTTVSGVLTIANAHYLNATSSTWDLSGTGTPFIKTGNFIFGTSRFRYSGAGANVTATTFYDLDLNAAVGSPTYTALGSGLAVAHNLTVGGTAATTANFTTNDPAVSVDGNLTIASNGIVLASDSAHLSLAGSYTNNGTFTSNGGTVIFTGSSPQSITPGGSSFATLTVTGSGDYTMLNNATATIAFTLASTSVFTLTATKTMAVGGTFTNDSGSTTWAGSTLYLYGAGNYQINDKSVSDTYGALQIGTNTHIRAWNSSADTVTTEAGASLYSMDHAGADGDLYVYGSYYKTSGTDDWSYATDFDGTALGGSSRPAHVYLQGGASAVFQSGGALSVLGMSTASTTIQNQGSGVYTLAVGSAGSTTMQYYAIQNAGVAGLTLAGTATVGTLSYGSFLVANDSDSGMTVAGSVIDANPAKTFTGNSFATSSGVTSAYNVTATGTAVSSWRFTNHSGTLAGEAYDNDPGGDPGYIVWADSASAITVSGHVYSDEGLTVSSACNGSSDITITVGGITSTSTNCNAGTGLYSFAGITFSPGDSFIVYINGVAQKAATVTVDPISNISDFDLYEHRVIVRHEDTNPIIIDDLAGYDSSDDADIPFTATNGSPDTLLLPADTMLLVWGSKTFAPGGNVTVSGGGAGADYDGSARLLSNATWTGVGTQLFSFGGSFQLDAGATFTAGNSTTTFTTSGIGRVIDVNGNQFYNVSFTGSGDWNVTDSTLSTHNLVMTNGVLTLPLATTTLSGGLDVTGGSFITNNSPLVFTATTADTTVRFGGSNVADLLFAGSGSWIMKDTNATSTGSMTVSAGTVTLPSGSLAVAHNFLTTGGTITHNNDRLVLTSTSSALLKAGNSNLGSVVFAGVGPFTMADTNLTLVGDLVIATGTVTFASGTLSVGGSFDTLNGAFDNATGTVLFNASAVGKTINPGVSPFYNLQIGAPSGEYTLESATTTNNFTLASVTSFTLNAGATLTVNGVFTNSVGGSATTWLDSTLNVTSGTNYSINGKTTGGDRYETLIIGPNTDISSWNTSATATVVAENSSWYSKDHAGVDGSLYIFGDYHISTTTHYWSYATDFDGTALGGTPRDVTVSFAANATTTMTSGALNIIGASGHETTLTNQGSGTYAFTVSGGILNAQHYAFRNLDENGLSLSGTANITSLSYGDFALAVSGGSLITLDAGTLNANASLVSTGNVFATTTAITGYNVTLVGSTASAWTFIGHTGNLAGEAFDNDGVDACGQIRWSDSACLLTQETHYRWRNDDGGIGVPNSEWYDVNWGARQRVRIANADATTYTDAAVELTVPYDTDMQSSFGDLRFTDSSGTTSLPYFIASTTPSVSAEVWVKVPSVPASDTATIYMYYKNATSTSIGSSTQVFIAADDFEDNSISEYAGDTTLFTTGTGFAYGGSRGLDNVGHVNAKANTGIGRLDQTISQGQTIEYKQYIDTTGHGDEVCTLFGIQSVASSTNYAVCLEQFGTHRLSLVKNAKNTDSSGVVLASTTVTFSSGWYDVSVDWKTSNGIDVTLSQGGVVVATTTATDSSYTSGGYGFTYWINYGGWDNFTARPYLTTAPTIYFGTKQGNGGATWRVAQDVTGSGYTTGDTARLRVAIENTGTLVNHTYQLEYAPMGVALSCEAVAAGSFVAVAPSASCGTDAICMATSSVVSDGTVTSDLLNISNGNFVTGSFVSDPSNSAATISIPTNAYTEVEYTLTLTPYVTDQNLCFRVTDNGTDLDGYQAVAKISLQFDPVFGPVSVNGGQDIVLTPGATTTIYATGTVTDYNGYSDIVAGTSTLYRSGAGAACSPDDNNCYISTTNNACSFTNCAGNTCTMACSVDMYYFADPTDAGTYIGEDWEAYLEVNDTGGGYDFASALPVEVLSLRALTVDNAINYGALSVNTNTGTYNASTTVVNDGNTPFDVEIDGSDLTDGASSIIPASEQKFASSTFDYSACVSCAVASSTAPVLVGIDLLKPTVATPPVSAPIYWGIAVPLGVNSAPHQGINVLTPVLP